MIARAGAVAAEIGGADRLVGLLGVLLLRRIDARLVRHVAGIVAGRDRLAGGRDRLRREIDAVGPHVGDRAVLVEALRHPHRVAGREAQFARRLLLEGRGGEGRRRVAGEGLGLDRRDGEAPGLDGGLGSIGRAFVPDRQAIDLLAPEADEAGHELGAVRLHQGGDAPIFLGLEQLDLALAIDDEAQRDGLDAARRLGAGQLTPQHRREGEADQIIERAAGAIGVDQIVVELARLLHRLGHRRLGDGVEGDALDLLRQRAALLQHLLDVPGNRLAFAVRVGGEDQGVGLLRLVGDRLELPRLVGIGLPLHREAGVRIDRAVLGRQIADVAVGGEHAVTAAKIFLDGLRLGGRFDDDKLHGKRGSFTRIRA